MAPPSGVQVPISAVVMENQRSELRELHIRAGVRMYNQGVTHRHNQAAASSEETCFTGWVRARRQGTAGHKLRTRDREQHFKILERRAGTQK